MVTSDADVPDWRADATALAGDLRRVQEALHRYPEVGLDLPRSQRTVLDALAGLPVEVVLGTTSSSVVSVLRGTLPGPTVFLRADLDALPLHEDSGAVRSELPGVMHACGHDLHAAMLVGATRLLAGQPDLPGTVVSIWQPGEEGHEGMQAMLDDGLAALVEAAGADAASYGLHVLSGAGSSPAGVFTGRAGASHASTASFTVEVRGQGGHAAFPHQAADPVVGAAAIVTALQVRVARTVDVFDPAVVTIGSIHGGSAPNTIPETVTLQGTARCFSGERAPLLHRLVVDTAYSVAAAHGVEAVVDWVAGYPAVMNDAAEVVLFADTVRELFGTDRFEHLAAPIPAGDDYARLLELVPGAFLLLGAGMPHADGHAYPNHSPGVVFDNRVLADGAAALAAVTHRRLTSPRQDPRGES